MAIPVFEPNETSCPLNARKLGISFFPDDDATQNRLYVAPRESTHLEDCNALGASDGISAKSVLDKKQVDASLYAVFFLSCFLVAVISRMPHGKVADVMKARWATVTNTKQAMMKFLCW